VFILTPTKYIIVTSCSALFSIRVFAVRLVFLMYCESFWFVWFYAFILHV